MLKREVREMVKYLISERKSFKVIFANGQVEVVENRGYCLVLNGKAYSNEELVEKMVRFQNNEKKFILSFEEIEEVESVEEEQEVNYEESLVEEVENLTDDLFQESDIAYAEEAIERESNKKEIDIMYQQIADYINSLNEKELKNLYERYYDMAFTFNIDSDEEKFVNTMYVVQLIDNTLREKGYWKKI